MQRRIGRGGGARVNPFEYCAKDKQNEGKKESIPYHSVARHRVGSPLVIILHDRRLPRLLVADYYNTPFGNSDG